MAKIFPVPERVARYNGHWAATFHDPTWRTNFHILWNVNGKQLQRYCSRKIRGAVDDDNEFSACCLDFDQARTPAIVIAVKKWVGSADCYDSLAHEALHAVNYVIGSRGMKLTNETEEGYAYLLGSIVGRSVALINKSRRLRRAA